MPSEIESLRNFLICHVNQEVTADTREDPQTALKSRWIDSNKGPEFRNAVRKLLASGEQTWREKAWSAIGEEYASEEKAKDRWAMIIEMATSEEKYTPQGLRFSCRFISDAALKWSRLKILEHYNNLMRNEEYRQERDFAADVSFDRAIGEGYVCDDYGAPETKKWVKDIKAVRFIFRWEMESRKWHEITGMPLPTTYLLPQMSIDLQASLPWSLKKNPP